MLLAMSAALFACSPAKAPPQSAAISNVKRPKHRASTPEELIAQAQAEHLPFEDPLALPPEAHAEALRFVGTFGDPAWRIRRLMAYVNEVLDFRYAPNITLTAERTYLTRRGDCMAFANLFISLARGMGLQAFFVHVSEVLSHYEHKGILFTSSHVAVGFGSGPQSVVIDITQERTDWKLAMYQAVDDLTALALYYNNIAVDALTTGRVSDAERILLFLYNQTPHIEEVHNNLAVVMNRRFRYKDSLTILLNAIRWFPLYKPFYTNGMLAAQGANRPDLAKKFEEGGLAIERQDPYFLVARGRNHFENKEYDKAIEQFEKAFQAKPDSAVIAAWLTRALMKAGRTEEGEAVFTETLKRSFGQSPLLTDELVREFPSLERLKKTGPEPPPK